MMWDIGGYGISNAMSDRRSRSRSPQPPHIRMPSPDLTPSQANPTTGGPPFSVSMSLSYPPVAPSASYNSYIYPSIPRAAPVPSPAIHHSKHHSKNKQHDYHQHSGHNHSHSHSQPWHLPVPSPSPISPPTYFPISPSASFPMQSPRIHFPTVPPRPPFRSSSTNDLLKVPLSGYIQSKPHTKHSPKPTAKPKPHKYTPQLPVQPLPHPGYQYSKCTGRRRALCIGINYRGQENELRGCINDARNVYDFLLRNNYKNSEITLLTDDTNDPRGLPTHDNILGAMRWLVSGAKRHDSLFFHYSGHGGQTPDLNGDETDGWDEVIYPLDFKSRGHIVDDLMHDIMVRPLPPGCRLTGLFDACHSGSVLDLPYVYSAHGRLKSSPITPRAQASKATPADVISWSACQDDQTSADTFAGGVAVGAMSHAFITAITDRPDQSYQELFRSLRLILHPRYKQKPQLGSSHPIDTNLRFIF